MALLSIYRGTQAEVSERPVSDGALLFATDTKKIYLDQGNNRVQMSSLQDLSDYVTYYEVGAALEEEASARQEQDQLLEQAIDGKAAISHTHDTASTSAAGFMPQLSGSTANYLRGDGSWGTPTTTVAKDSITLAKLASDVGTVAVQSSTPTDSNVKIWIQI